MRKATKLCIYTLTAAMLLAGCSSQADSKETTAATETAATESAAAGESSEAAEDIPEGSVELGEYKGIEVTRTVLPVTDEDVDAKIQEILTANAEYLEGDKDVEAQNGDIVNIDFVGKHDGVEFEGGAGEAYDLTLGSGSFIDGFEDGLIGAKIGEERSLNLTFPDPYTNPDLAGEDVVFDVTVNAIQVRRVPEFDEAFVQKMNPDMKTTDEYTAQVRADLEAAAETYADAEAENEVLLTVINNATFTDVDAQIQAQYDEMWEQTEAMVNVYGMGMADYAAFYNTDEEGLKQILHDQVANTVKMGLISQAIAEAEGLTVEDSDREEVAEEQGTDVDTLLQTYGEGMIDEYVIQKKATELIIDNAVIK